MCLIFKNSFPNKNRKCPEYIKTNYLLAVNVSVLPKRNIGGLVISLVSFTLHINGHTIPHITHDLVERRTRQ